VDAQAAPPEPEGGLHLEIRAGLGGHGTGAEDRCPPGLAASGGVVGGFRRTWFIEGSLDLIHSFVFSCSLPLAPEDGSARSVSDVSTFELAPRLAGHVGRRFPVRSSHLDVGVGIGAVPVTADLGAEEVSRWSPWYGVTLGLVFPGSGSAFEIEIGRFDLPRRTDDGVPNLRRTLARLGFAWAIL
jgi:hypothetical protein